MSNENEKNSVTLTGDDRANAERLYTQVQASLHELAQIAAKALGTSLTTESAVKGTNRLVILKEEPIHLGCDGKGNCYCMTWRDNAPYIYFC